MDRDLRGESRERRESRRLTKGRSLEHDPVGGGGGVRRTEEGGYHHMDHSGVPPRQAGPVPPGGRGRGMGLEVGDGMQPGQRTVGGVGGAHEHTLAQQGPPPELREPLGSGPGSAPGQGPVVRRTKREKAESMLRNDSLSSDQSESLRPPPPRPYKSKRGLGAGGKRQTSVSSSEEDGGTTPEYSSCEDAEIESVSERGERQHQSLRSVHERPALDFSHRGEVLTSVHSMLYSSIMIYLRQFYFEKLETMTYLTTTMWLYLTLLMSRRFF